MKNRVVLITTTVLLFVSLGAFSYGTISRIEPFKSIKESVDFKIKSKLIDLDPLETIPESCTVYILGGSQPSLELKFKVAASLYKRGKCERILILHAKGKTGFSPSLGRNLSYDEWAIGELEKLGVPNRVIHPIDIQEGFFGTFSEAKGIAHYVKKAGITCITLITAPYHTRRTRVSFQRFLRGANVKIHVLASNEKSYLRDDIMELAKLVIYEHVLLRSAK